MEIRSADVRTQLVELACVAAGTEASAPIGLGGINNHEAKRLVGPTILRISLPVKVAIDALQAALDSWLTATYCALGTCSELQGPDVGSGLDPSSAWVTTTHRTPDAESSLSPT